MVVSIVVIRYGEEYMRDSGGIQRYSSVLKGFIGSMLILILGGNRIVMYIG
jgi:NADH:ubiquinone oxidoreductase subunit 5 (subunit L)/multisubunit Na+/H+ antiporter MnhA subunit